MISVKATRTVFIRFVGRLSGTVSPDSESMETSTAGSFSLDASWYSSPASAVCHTSFISSFSMLVALFITFAGSSSHTTNSDSDVMKAANWYFRAWGRSSIVGSI